MPNRIKIVLLSLGVLFGFGSAFGHAYHHRHGWDEGYGPPCHDAPHGHGHWVYQED